MQIVILMQSTFTTTRKLKRLDSEIDAISDADSNRTLIVWLLLMHSLRADSELDTDWFWDWFTTDADSELEADCDSETDALSEADSS